MIYYRLVALHKDKAARNVGAPGARDETVQHKAYDTSPTGQRTRVLVISRESADSATLTIRSLKTGAEIQLPWSNVRHAEVDPSAPEEPARRGAK